MSANFLTRLADEHASFAATLPKGQGQSAARREALRQVSAAGLPALRDDAWRYSNLRPVEKARLAPAAPLAGAQAQAAARALLPDPLPGFARLVFLNGKLQGELSADPKGLEGARLDVNAAGGEDAMLPVTADERFAWLNAAFASEQIRLAVSGSLQVELLFIAAPTEDHGALYPRLKVTVADNARLVLVERHLGSGGAAALNAPSVEIKVGANAAAEHYRLQALGSDALIMDSLLASLSTDARYELTLLSWGAASARHSTRIRLDGERAALLVNGMSLADAQRVLDTAVQVEHVARNTTSEQLLRAIANGQSGISFNSRVDVAPHAGGADSRQSLKGLIGSIGAEVNLRPQLEISTDEVKASHGATTGALDENMLFYLLSRGLDPDTARKLLEWAFIEDVMSRIRIPALRRQVELASVDCLGNATAREALR
jgi:Fe-S cluster assembly protein SufD